MVGRELDLRTPVREQPLHRVLRSSPPLELKEPQRLLDLGAPLRGRRIQRARSRVREIPLVRERGVQKRSQHRLTDPRPFLCRRSELRSVKLQHPPAIPLGETSGASRGVVEQGTRTVRTTTVDEWVEFPHRRRQLRVTDLSRNHRHPRNPIRARPALRPPRASRRNANSPCVARETGRPLPPRAGCAWSAVTRSAVVAGE
jgi:hypothetical protein